MRNMSTGCLQAHSTSRCDPSTEEDRESIVKPAIGLMPGLHWPGLTVHPRPADTENGPARIGRGARRAAVTGRLEVSDVETVIIAVAAAGAAVVAYLGWRWWVALAEVTRGLEALGTRVKRAPVLSAARGPVGRLVKTFNAAAAETEAVTARLDQDRQQLRVVLEAMDEAVIAVDPRRRLLFANASANRLFGLEEASAGRLVPELIRGPQVQDAVEATLRLAGPSAPTKAS